MKDIGTYFYGQDLVLLGVSMLVGLIVGAEREYHNKSAGLRTLMLVSVGACIFTILSIRIGAANPDRIAANIITGIGFLGAGVIFKDNNKVNGLTTACTIWITAALGMAVGSGHVSLALWSACIVLAVLWILVYLEKWIDRKHKIITYCITMENESDIGHISAIFKKYHIKANPAFRNKNHQFMMYNWRCTGKASNHKKALHELLTTSFYIDISE